MANIAFENEADNEDFDDLPTLMNPDAWEDGGQAREQPIRVMERDTDWIAGELSCVSGQLAQGESVKIGEGSSALQGMGMAGSSMTLGEIVAQWQLNALGASLGHKLLGARSVIGLLRVV